MQTSATSNRSLLQAFAFIAILFANLQARAADDKAVEPPHPTKFRLSGMFSPEREAALREFAKEITDFTFVNIDYKNAEITLEYELVKLFPTMNPKQFKMLTPEKIVERLDALVRQATNSTFRIFAASTTPKDKLVVEEITIGVLDCQGCCLAVHDMLAKVDGVERTVIVSKTGQLSVTIDPARTNRAALEDALNKQRVTILSKKAE
jgi:hypothetical protein